MLSMAALASQFPGFSKWIYGAQHSPNHTTSPALHSSRPAAYRPQFFTPAEYELLDHLTALIIPTDDTPGAREAGASEFIDFMAANDPTIQQAFRDGLHWLNGRARQAHMTDFGKLSPEQQNALLKTVAYRRDYLPGQEAEQKFFLLLRRYTVMGYYTSRIGLEELDFPGLKLYTESPACPHHGDPEHRHLPAARY